MAVKVTRRGALQGSAALAAAALLPARAFADDQIETHGLSSFGDLALPPDFKNLAYVNPEAPKGGLLSLQITATGGNQNFDTFDTLNIYSRKGDGAAGMSACFDTLMTGNGDEPDLVYGLLARAVRYTADKLEYRFLLRPEARFSDGTKLTAADVAFSFDVLKTKGHPVYMRLLEEVVSATAESDDVALIRFAPTRSRDAHLIAAGMPIFSKAYWASRDFEAATLDPPLGSGAYKVGRFEADRYIEFDRDPAYWAKDLPINLGQNNFAKLRFEYYRERQVAFEAFKAGALNFHEELTVAYWVSGYDFPAAKEGRVKKETLHSGAPSRLAGLLYEYPPRTIHRPARARGDRPLLRFRMDQQKRQILDDQAGHLLFPEHRHGGQGRARPGGAGDLDAVSRQGSRGGVRRSLSAAGLRRFGQRSRATPQGQRPAARRRLQARWRRAQTAERQAVRDRVSRFLRFSPAGHVAVRAEPAEARH